jgi:hypothetical protein
MEVRIHRLVQQAILPALMPPSRFPENVQCQKPALAQDELDVVQITAQASGIPAVCLLGGQPALMVDQLVLLPLEQQELTVQRGWSGNDQTRIRQRNSRIEIERPNSHDHEVFVLSSPKTLEIQRSDFRQNVRISPLGEGFQIASNLPAADMQVRKIGQTLEIDRPQSQQDLSLERQQQSLYITHHGDGRRNLLIEKKGSDIAVEGWNQDNQLQVRQRGKTIEVDRWGTERDLTLHQRSNRIDVDYHWGSDADFQLRMSADQIEIDRWGSDKDVTIRRSGNRIEIDRWGTDRDLTLALRGQTLTIDRWGSDSDTVITGIAGRYTLHEAGMTISVGPEGLKLMALQLDKDLDVVF